jgi:outer membrane protein TolC
MREKLFHALFAALLSGGASLSLAQNVADTAELSFTAAVAEALAANPGLAAMRARAQALASETQQQNVLPDPRLQLNLVNVPLDSWDLRAEDMTQLEIGISQMLPYPGKLALQETAAAHEQRAAESDEQEIRLSLARDVKTLWWNLYYVDRALETIERNRRVMRQFVDVAQSKYKVGEGMQQDVLMAQLELSKLQAEEISLRSLRRGQEAGLNTLLNRPTVQPLRLPARESDELVEVGDEAQLLSQALEHRPLLAAYRDRLDAARARVGLAKKDYYPDFELGASYGYRGDAPDGRTRSDMASFMLSMNLPIHSRERQDKAVDQRNRQWLEAQYLLDDAQRQVSAEVSQALAEYRQAQEQLSLLRKGIIPQANQTVAAMLAAYQVNKVDFLDLARTQLTLFEYETRAWLVLSQGQQALARLSAAVGNDVHNPLR